MEKIESSSPFYRHKEGRSTCTGGGKSRRLLPESRVHSGFLLYKVHCAALEGEASGVVVVLGDVLSLWRSRRRLCDSCRGRGGYCGGYRPLCSTWRRLEGPACGGLTPVEARAAFEGSAHVD